MTAERVERWLGAARGNFRRLREKRKRRRRLLHLESLEHRHLLSAVSILKDINEGPVGSWPAEYTEDWEPVAIGNTLYSVADDGSNGRELWKTDGTEDGTERLDLASGATGSNPTNLTAVGDWLWFGATNVDSTSSGLSILRTNGTAVEFVHDFGAGTSAGVGARGATYPAPEWTAVGGRLAVVVNDGVGENLYISNSVDSPTGFNLVSIDNATNSGGNGDGYAAPIFLSEMGGALFVTADDGTLNSFPTPADHLELWKVSGDLQPTVEKMFDIKQGGPLWISDGIDTYSTAPGFLTVVGGNELIFGVDRQLSGGSGLELYKTNGTVGNFTLVQSFADTSQLPEYLGYLRRGPEFTDVNGTLYGVIDDGTNGFRLWTSDLGVGGTQMVTSATSENPGDLVNVDGTLFFGTSASPATGEDVELWKVSGLTATKVYDFGASSSLGLYGSFLTHLDGMVYGALDADDGAGIELWVTDGSVGNAARVSDINPGAADSYPQGMTTFNGMMVFSADDGSRGREPWILKNFGDDIVGRFDDGSFWQWWTAKGSDAGKFDNQHSGTWGQVAWQDIMTGDFNGDGYDDVVGRYDDGSFWQWWIAKGSASGQFTNQHAGTWGQVAWQDIMVGDFNGDGYDDLVGRYDDGSLWQWWIAKGSATGNLANQHAGAWGQVAWQDTLVGDFNGDGNDDVVGRYDDGSFWQWWVAKGSTSGVFTNQHSGTWGQVAWQDIMVGDFNGDDKDDLVGRYDDGSLWQWWVAKGSVTGSLTNQHAGTWGQVAWQDIMVGDFNGDGRDDVVGRYDDGSSWQWWVAHGSASGGFTNQHSGTWGQVAWQNIMVGDFNGDGKDDVVGRYDDGVFWQWWVAEGSTLGGFTNQLWGRWGKVPWNDIMVGNFGD